MPEGDTIFRTARTLQRAIGGQVVTGFRTQLPRLGRVHEDTPLTGRTVESVDSAGKWLTIRFSGDLILLTHMLMSGSWHIYRPGEKWRRKRDDMRIVIETAAIHAVGFTVPVAEFHTSESLERRPGFRQLGQDLLAEQFDESAAAAQLRAHPQVEIGDALLTQSLIAGVGNVFKSEICFACEINPFRKVESLSIAQIARIVKTSRKFLLANVTDKSGDKIVTWTGYRRTTGAMNGEESLWVYGRRRLPCRRCGTPIEARKQGRDARVTFWCPKCQE